MAALTAKSCCCFLVLTEGAFPDEGWRHHQRNPAPQIEHLNHDTHNWKLLPEPQLLLQRERCAGMLPILFPVVEFDILHPVEADRRHLDNLET